jgi:hypothetical protein
LVIPDHDRETASVLCTGEALAVSAPIAGTTVTVTVVVAVAIPSPARAVRV